MNQYSKEDKLQWHIIYIFYEWKKVKYAGIKQWKRKVIIGIFFQIKILLYIEVTEQNAPKLKLDMT